MDTAKLMSSVPTGLWIGGEERSGSKTFDVFDPSDDHVLASVADATPGDAITAYPMINRSLAVFAGSPR